MKNNFGPICIYCAHYLSVVEENADFYPQCKDFSKPQIPITGKCDWMGFFHFIKVIFVFCFKIHLSFF